jgi:hypothetical protein
MADLIQTLFQDGQAVNAAQLNAIVNTYNQLCGEFNSLKTAYDSLSKSQVLVRAVKSSQLSFTGNGNPTQITGWTALKNAGNLFNAANGATSIAALGDYRITLKTLVSASNATSPRSKLTILVNGADVGLSEDNTFQEQTAIVQNYRVTHVADALVTLSPGMVVTPRIQVWGAASGGVILGDANTVLTVERVY